MTPLTEKLSSTEPIITNNHIKKYKFIYDRLVDIAWINSLDSKNFYDSIIMIKEKGYDNELVYEIGLNSDDVIKMLENDDEFKQISQYIYEQVVIFQKEEAASNRLFQN